MISAPTSNKRDLTTLIASFRDAADFNIELKNALMGKWGAFINWLLMW